MKPIEILKGTKYYNSKEQILREWVMETIKEVLQKYGFNPIETPILQLYKLLASKYGGGEEILNECYKLKDRGKRNLGLRYELTITLAPFLSENQNLKLPFKRYEIGKIFRDGPLKKSRLREFTQVDFDIIGTDSKLAEFEILGIYEEVFRKLDLDIEILINNRKILLGMLEYAGIKKNQNSVILTIDKLKKIGEKGVKKELKEKGLKEKEIKKLFEILKIKGSNKNIINKLEEKLKTKSGKEGVEEIMNLMELTECYGLKTIRISPSLARGLNYYTGMIYEIFSKKRETNSSLGAGGRYDNLFKNMLDKDLPSVGGSFGVDAIVSIMEPKKKSKVQVYLIPVGLEEKDYFPILKELRREINADFNLGGKGVSKSLEFANKNQIPFCLIVGKEEINKNKVKLKNMDTGKEETMDLKEAIKEIKQSTISKKINL